MKTNVSRITFHLSRREDFIWGETYRDLHFAVECWFGGESHKSTITRTRWWVDDYRATDGRSMADRFPAPRGYQQ